MSNIHTIARYKNLGIRAVCHMVKSPGLQGKIGMSGWDNKRLLIEHTQVSGFRPHEPQPLKEIIQAGLVGVAYEEAVEEVLGAAGVEEFL